MQVKEYVLQWKNGYGVWMIHLSKPTMAGLKDAIDSMLEDDKTWHKMEWRIAEYVLVESSIKPFAVPKEGFCLCGRRFRPWRDDDGELIKDKCYLCDQREEAGKVIQRLGMS